MLLKRTFIVLGVGSLVVSLTPQQLASRVSAAPADRNGLTFPYYDPNSSDCSPARGGLVTAGYMSLQYPNFSDETTIARNIEASIRRAAPNSPWLKIDDFGNRFVAESKRLNVNPLLVVVIGRKESVFGTSGDSSLPRFNSFGDKIGRSTYRDYGSWERSLFGGDGITNDNNQSFTSRVAYRLSGKHVNYASVKNMYEYLSVHLTGRIFNEGDGSSVFDPAMGVNVDLSNVVNYHDDAKVWIAEITGESVTSGPNSVSACTSTGVVNGNIVATTFALAWTEAKKVQEISNAKKITDGLCTMEESPTACGNTKARAGGKIREADAKPDYISAVKQYNRGNDSDGANWAFSDCGVFVATVLRASGVDTGFAARGTGSQLSYVKNSPSYDTVLFTDTSQLLPGDILIKDGHIAIYVGPNQVTDTIVVQASWGQHVPIANQKTVTPGDGYYRARKI